MYLETIFVCCSILQYHEDKAQIKDAMKIGKVICYYFVPSCFDSKEVPDDMNIFFQITLASSWTFEDLKTAVAGIDSLRGISEINLKVIFSSSAFVIYLFSCFL